MESAGRAARRKGQEVVRGTERVRCSMRNGQGKVAVPGTGSRELEMQKEGKRRRECDGCDCNIEKV